MTRRWLTRTAFLALGGGAPLLLMLTAETQALAAPCSDLPNPVYLTGSTAFQPTAAQFALRATTKGTTLVYFGQGSCLAPPAIIESTPLTGTGTYYVADADPTKPPVAMTCDVAAGTVPDLGVADVSYKSCTNAEIPASIADFPGPVQAMEFIVPKASPLTAIS